MYSVLHINNESKAAVYSLLLSGRLARRFRWRGLRDLQARRRRGRAQRTRRARALSRRRQWRRNAWERASSGAGACAAAGVAGVEGVDAVERVTRVGDAGTAGVAGGLGGLTTTRTVRGGECRASVAEVGTSSGDERMADFFAILTFFFALSASADFAAARVGSAAAFAADCAFS